MSILVINAGSSSVKYQLISSGDESVLAKGLIERIDSAGSNIMHVYGGKTYAVEKPVKDHVEAVELMLSVLLSPEYGVIKSIDEIHAVGHRVVHGGEKFASSVLIDENVIAAIEENCPLAPLHNPANLMGITACREVMPDTPMVAVFDTAFHQTMPKMAFLYGLPYDYYKRLKIRRYGFHGTSHRYVAGRAAEIMGRPIKKLKLITCHLGNGSSLCAVDGGKSIDTSMGMTPLEGVIMGTRSGSIDPAIIEYIMEAEGLDIHQVMDVLNKKSGLIGLSGKSHDMRDVRQTAFAGDTKCQATIDAWAYGIAKTIGAYAAAMHGVDALIFTAGIGENDAAAREKVMSGLTFLGAELDVNKNENVHGEEREISTPASRVKVYVIPTNEELAIMRDTVEIIDAKARKKG